jgi:hypothetical protein
MRDPMGKHRRRRSEDAIREQLAAWREWSQFQTEEELRKIEASTPINMPVAISLIDGKQKSGAWVSTCVRVMES